MKTRFKLMTIIIAGLALSLSASADLNENLILHYTFDGDYGTTVVDQSGSGNDGVWTNSCIYTNGVFGQGLKIHGNSLAVSKAGGHVLLPEIDFNAMDEVTIAFWINEVEMHHPHGQGYFSAGSASHFTPLDEIRIGHNSSDGILYICGTSVTTGEYPVVTHRFAHYVMTFSDGAMQAYLNGELLEELPASLNVSRPELVALGRSWWDNGSSTCTRLTAIYDDVRVYDRALSNAEILELAKVSPVTLTEGYYLFDVKANAQLLLDGKKGIAVSTEKVLGMLIYNADTSTSQFVYSEGGKLVVTDADFSYTPYTNSEKESKKGLTAQGAASAQFSADGFLNSVLLGSFRYQETAKGIKMSISLAGTGINTEDDMCGTLQLRYNQKNSDALNSANDVEAALQELMDSMKGKKSKKRK